MRTHEEDTAGPCSLASFNVSSKVLSGTSHDASEEVSIFPHLLPMSDKSGIRRESSDLSFFRRCQIEGGKEEHK